MIDGSSPPAFTDWWEARAEAYLRECLGPVEVELRRELSQLLFPIAAEPTLSEQALPVAFAHLRLLAGEELAIVLKRLESLAVLFGFPGAKLKIGTVYLLLVALTSMPGRLSSLARGQSAFFSLLICRVRDLLDRGVSEDSIRAELAEFWEIQAARAVSATLDGARGLWRRTRDTGFGLMPLRFDLSEWLKSNGLEEEVRAARALFSRVGGKGHLAALAERLAVIEALRTAIESGREPSRVSEWEQVRTMLVTSVEGGLNGLTPWEKEVLKPTPSLLSSLIGWARRLSLLDEGETPTAHPGRERLPDWLVSFLKGSRPSDGIVSVMRFTIGGDTYLVAGIEATAPAALVSVQLVEPSRLSAECLDLRVRFGEGTERSFPFDLTNGKDLLAALFLAEQPDIRLDLIVHGEDGRWRFGASIYLVLRPEDREQWLRYAFEYLYSRFDGEEDRIRLSILRGVKNGGTF